MGWLFCARSKSELVDHVVNENFTVARKFNVADGRWIKRSCWGTSMVKAKAVVGNSLWMVVTQKIEYAESETAPVTETKEETVIVLCRLEREGSTDATAWGYKDMSEAMHPYYFDCPLKFLAMAPETSKEWRETVRKVHAEKAAKRAVKMAVGDTLVLAEGCKPDRLEVVSVSPLRGKSAAGVVFKVPRKMVARVEKAKAVAGLEVVAV